MGKKSLKGALKRHEQKQSYEQRLKKQQAHKEAVEKARKTSKHPKRPWIPFADTNLTVFIGEADFSFAVSCLQENYVGQSLVTNLDTIQDLVTKYPNTETNLEYLQTDARVDAVLHEVDARALRDCNELSTHVHKFQESDSEAFIDFVFNFPHLGSSIADMQRNIRAHQQLILDFLGQVKLYKNARAIIALFEGEPYDSWEVKVLARQVGFKLERSGNFEWSSFPNYSHCLTKKFGKTSKSQSERRARFYMFSVKHDEEELPASAKTT